MGSELLDIDPETSGRLAKMPQRDTSIEKSVRQYLHSLGLRFRISNRDLVGSPDIANRTNRWVVFVHGCFWHHHQGCKRATIPKRNRAFWLEKFRANRLRDEQAVRELQKCGFTCIVLWECEIREQPETIVKKLSCLKPGGSPG